MNRRIGIEISPDRRSLNNRTQDGGSRLSPLELESITATEEFSPDLLSHIQELGAAAWNLGVEQVIGPNRDIAQRLEPPILSSAKAPS